MLGALYWYAHIYWQAFGLSMALCLHLLTTYTMILSDHLLIMIWFPDRNGIFQDDNATIRKGELITLWLEQYK